MILVPQLDAGAALTVIEAGRDNRAKVPHVQERRLEAIYEENETLSQQTSQPEVPKQNFTGFASFFSHQLPSGRLV